MKTLFPVLLLASASVTAGTLSLDAGPYWQVQNAVTYGTACEGHITTCEAPDGFYHVINHTTGERRENVAIGGSSSHEPVADPSIVINVCENVTTPDGFSGAECEVSCPANTVPVDTACAAWQTDVIVPSAKVLTESGARCIIDYFSEANIEVTARCL